MNVQDGQSPKNRVASRSYTLPDELLCLIFRSIRLVEGTSVDMISISHVCYRWRSVALHCPDLWSHLALEHGGFTPTLIERAKGEPLHLYEPQEYSWNRRSLNTLQWIDSNIINSIDLQLRIDLAEQFCDYLDSHTWDSLELLAISTDYDDSAFTCADFTFGGRIPPKLHHVRLCNIGPGYHARTGTEFGKNLRSLELELDSELLPSLSSFLDMIETNPQLESLSLTVHGRWPFDYEHEDPIPEPSRLVTLNHLRSLTIKENKYIPYILAHLAIPYNPNRGLHCQLHARLEPEELDSAESQEASPLPVPGPLFCIPQIHSNIGVIPAVSAVSFRQNNPLFSDWEFGLFARRLEPANWEDARDGLSIFLAGWGSPDEEEKFDPSIRLNIMRIGHVFQHSPLSHLEFYVPLNFLRGMAIEDWITLFRSLPFLTTFKYEKPIFKSPCDGIPDPPPPLEGSPDCLLPLLQALAESSSSSLVAPAMITVDLKGLSPAVLSGIQDDVRQCVQIRRESGVATFQVVVDDVPYPGSNL
ncbi:hypothetical protein BXZ70DRAFT_63859 [Cristinia sonorae]|uniref:F-box domain-containing protein n=1 Tax=Cristinia sonorae TaxID=1940300 RepID=A0A8K0XRV3_9AGAR|nr:hypothetical protein BXZ70DRAFT_63859 [Cristinia sonorae]